MQCGAKWVGLHPSIHRGYHCNKRVARQANEASETVVPTTFVDDAEFIWRELDEENPNKKTQEQVAEIMGWGRTKVANYAALDRIAHKAWGLVVTTFERDVTAHDQDDVTSVVTTVTFTEVLLRSILDLRAPQQLDLVSRLAAGDINKSRFKNQAEAYSTRNARRQGGYGYAIR